MVKSLSISIDVKLYRVLKYLQKRKKEKTGQSVSLSSLINKYISQGMQKDLKKLKLSFKNDFGEKKEIKEKEIKEKEKKEKKEKIKNRINELISPTYCLQKIEKIELQKLIQRISKEKKE